LENLWPTTTLGSDAVTSHSGEIVDDGDIHPGEAVEEGRFTHIRAAYDSDSFQHDRDRKINRAWSLAVIEKISGLFLNFGKILPYPALAA
jgi:hypothetical protein